VSPTHDVAMFDRPGTIHFVRTRKRFFRHRTRAGNAPDKIREKNRKYQRPIRTFYGKYRVTIFVLEYERPCFQRVFEHTVALRDQ